MSLLNYCCFLELTVDVLNLSRKELLSLKTKKCFASVSFKLQNFKITHLCVFKLARLTLDGTTDTPTPKTKLN